MLTSMNPPHLITSLSPTEFAIVEWNAKFPLLAAAGRDKINKSLHI